MYNNKARAAAAPFCAVAHYYNKSRVRVEREIDVTTLNIAIGEGAISNVIFQCDYL